MQSTSPNRHLFCLQQVLNLTDAWIIICFLDQQTLRCALCGALLVEEAIIIEPVGLFILVFGLQSFFLKLKSEGSQDFKTLC